MGRYAWRSASSRRALLIRSAVFLHDIALAGLAYWAALSLRQGFAAWPSQSVMIAAGLVIASAVVSNWLVGLNRGVWRYASLAELTAIVKYAFATTALFWLLCQAFFPLGEHSLATIIVTILLMVFMTSAMRIAYRMQRSRRAVNKAAVGGSINTLLIGASDDSELFLKAISERPDLPYRALGIIDERNRRIGMSIHGVKVLSGIEGMERVVWAQQRADRPIEAVIFTKSRAKMLDNDFERIFDIATRNKLKLLRLPEFNKIRDIAEDRETILPQPVRLEDLLSRPPINIDLTAIESLGRGMTVLVTGAGGSIGSELCRQILGHAPKRLIVVDNSEFLLFTIQQELLGRAGSTQIVARYGDVRSRSGIKALFSEFRPDLVLHAAALKHVPIVESQPLEGLNTNVVGTRNVADACVESHVKAMVMISTDKAVNSANVMGASKRLAEMYCQSLDMTQKTRFVTVRFGNVLGSAGSVVPIFERQIEAGGPVTVTHPDIERFFMTIPEAVSLVLHATVHAMTEEGVRGNIHVLEMGRAVKIADMARKLIKLKGLQPDKDIRIIYTGLRPGEKLYEELFNDDEAPLPAAIPGVQQAFPSTPGLKVVQEVISDLQNAIEQNDTDAALQTLLHAECSYHPTAEMETRIQPVKVRVH